MIGPRYRGPAFDLSDKVALVTGAGRGLGRAMAVALAQAGAAVCAVSRTESELRETCAQIDGVGARSHGLAWDVGDVARADDLVAAATEPFGRLDILVHAAGVQVRKPALDVTLEDWDKIERIHLRAAFFLATATARHFIAAGRGGKIILVASLTSRIGLANLAPYAAAKSGLLGLVRTLAVEWAPHRIGVNAIGPGYFRTALTEEVLSQPATRENLLARLPAGRTGESEDLAGAVVFLAAPASDYVTGHTLFVDGGWLAG